MKEIIQLFAAITVAKKGPQDVPASSALMLLTVLGYFAVNVVITIILPPMSIPWMLPLLIDIVFTLGWNFLLLRVVGRPERFMQTTTAVFGYRALLTPLWVLTMWLVTRFQNDPGWQFPIALVGLAVVIWVIAVNSHILKAALEWSMAPAVALVILQMLAGELVRYALLANGAGA